MKITRFLFFSLFCIPSIWCLPKSTRIVGGNAASAGQFPYAAAIYKTTADGNYFGTGVLLNSEWVLTAAQCVDKATLLIVLLGTHKLSGDEETLERLATETYVVHPNYNPNTLENDLGLIKFREPVPMSTYIRGAYLPFADQTAGTAYGWGQITDGCTRNKINYHDKVVNFSNQKSTCLRIFSKTNGVIKNDSFSKDHPVYGDVIKIVTLLDDPNLSDTLNFVQLARVSDAECRMTYGDQIAENMACFEGNFNQGTCFGDSGSPIIQNISYGYTIVIAIASFFSGNGCESTDPSGYTRVYPYSDWISNVTRT